MLASNIPFLGLVKGNTALLLSDEQVVWRVQSGSLALFATVTDAAATPKGHRRYLFTVAAGEVLLGLPLMPLQNALDHSPNQSSDESTDYRGILALTLQSTELKAIALNDFLADIPTCPDTQQQLDTWIDHWSDWLNQHRLEALGDRNLQTLASRYHSLLQQQALQAPRGTVKWVHIQSGSTCWMGIDELPIEPTRALHPLTAATWLEAKTPAEIQLVPIEEATADQLAAGLTQFHRHLNHYLRRLEQQERAARFRRFQERERLDQQVAANAMSELAATLQPERSTFFQEGSPLLVAVGAVGNALDIPIRAPAASEASSRARDPLEEIAQASGFRTRRITLLGNWSDKDYGPLLAYTVDGQPVALLQNQKKQSRKTRYTLLNPVDLTQLRVDAAVAETLNREAWMFYRPLPDDAKHISTILRFAVQGHLKDIGLLIGLGVLGTLLGMLIPQATAILINDAIPDGDRAIVCQLGFALFAVSCGTTAFGITRGLLSLKIENAANGALQTAVWDKLLRLSPAFFRQYSTGDLLLRMLTISQIRTELSGATQQTLFNAVFSLLNLGLMFFYSVKLTIVAIIITIVTAVITSVSSFLILRESRKVEDLTGKLNSLSVELINGVAKLRVAAAEDRAFGVWAKLFSQKMRFIAAIQRIDNSVSVITEALPIVASVQIFWYATLFLSAPQSGTHGLTIGAFAGFNFAFAVFLSGVTGLSNTLTDILDIVPRWERAKPILEGKPEADLSKADPGYLTGQVRLEHVVFRYREDGPLVLDDVSLVAEPGEFIAIIGPSGGGKSTLLRILLGFETPTSGTVYYNGQDLAGLNVQMVRRQLGVVMQNGRIGAGPLLDNITAGALVSLDEAWDAARMAGFAEDIERMPMGMYTMVNEGGTNFSGGQRQRLLIARSLVLKPKLLLLDEATSALDHHTQAIVTNSLEQLNVTRIAIAHRLSTIRKADRIYVIEAGRVVQVGKFDELLRQDGLFARLAARQLDE